MAAKLRVVLDTNVIISVLINSKGPPGEILKAFRSVRFILVSSDNISTQHAPEPPRRSSWRPWQFSNKMIRRRLLMRKIEEKVEDVIHNDSQLFTEKKKKQKEKRNGLLRLHSYIA